MPSAKEFLSDMQIARLRYPASMKKMRCAAHAVQGTVRPIDSSHLHSLNVAFGPAAIAKASATGICPKAETAEVRALVQSRKIAPQKSRKIISQIAPLVGDQRPSLLSESGIAKSRDRHTVAKILW
jgi:hypothetical protein